MLNKFELEHLFSYNVKLNMSDVFGQVPDGFRANVYITGGTVSPGGKIKGILRPVGGDCATVRRDGVGIADVRGTVETDDGALLYIAYSGVMDYGMDAYEEFSNGNVPLSVRLQGAPRIQTSHPSYQWINRLQCLAIAELDFTSYEGNFDIYAIQ
jgi:hypothetical protein